MQDAQPIIQPILARLHESVDEYANVLGIAANQDAEEFGVSYAPAGAHAALLSASVWLSEVIQFPDLNLFERIFGSGAN